MPSVFIDKNSLPQPLTAQLYIILDRIMNLGKSNNLIEYVGKASLSSFVWRFTHNNFCLSLPQATRFCPPVAILSNNKNSVT